MGDKIQMGFYITPELDKKFREFLALKYRTVGRGLISHEIEQALGHWIALHTKAQSSLLTKAPNPLPKVSKVYLTIKQYLLSRYYEVLEPGSVVPIKYLREAIRQVRGSDKRTVQKWLKIFHQTKLIKPLNANTWELCA